MSAKIYSATLHALEAKIIDVEVDVSAGLPGTIIVGLADKAIRESKERVRACLKSSKNFRYPLQRISINLAPANIYKYGSQFDLAIAMGILVASEQISFNADGILLLGELALNGVVRGVNGALAMVAAAKERGMRKVILPLENLAEAGLVDGIELVAIEDIEQAVACLLHNFIPESNLPKLKFVREQSVDFSEITGQQGAKRALEISAAGGHNCAFTGPPGAGKTMLARSIASILPDPHSAQVVEIVKIHGISGALKDNKINPVPFRNPHHTISLQAFVGGGVVPRPGEISLAHNGILFLDEFSEFPRNIIESLRQPLESGEVVVSRMQSNYVFPANVILIAAQNPCPCGYWGEENNKCICSPGQIQKYRNKISGPILDRIDLQVYVPRVNLSEMEQPSESSAQAAKRVFDARKTQRQRFGNSKLNGRMTRAEISKYCVLDSVGKELIFAAEKKYAFSARTYFKILKVARTIADLHGEEKILQEYVAEALGYRVLENLE